MLSLTSIAHKQDRKQQEYQHLSPAAATCRIPAELKKNIWRGQAIHGVGLRSDLGMRGMMPHRAHVAGDAAETTMERLHQIQTAACTISMRQQDILKIMN